MIDKLESLIKTGSVEIQDGIFLSSDGEINLRIFQENDTVVIDLGSPHVYIKATSIGKAQVTNFFRPRVDKIVLTTDKIIVQLKNWMDLEYPR